MTMADNPDPAVDLDEFLGTPQESPWRSRAKWIVLGVVALIALVLVVRWMSAGDEVSYATAEVKRGTLSVTVSATGNLAPTNKVDVGSELSGLVEEVMVDVNDRVVRGQPIALLDPSRLDDAITRAQAALTASQAQVAQARATVSEAQASLNRLREVSRLSGGRVPAKTEMESAEAALARAIANQRSAEANVVSARAQLSSDQTQRYKSVIRSPVAGVVLARQIEPGQTVASSFNTPTLFVIAEDLASMELQVAIDEADVGQVKDGQSATFTVDAYPGQTFPARITRVDVGSNTSAQSSSSSSSSGAATSSTVVAYNAILSVANPDLLLRPGMTATADIAVQQTQAALLVPNAALRFSPEGRGGGREAREKSGVISAITPQRGRPGRRERPEQERGIGAGSRQTIYIVGENGEPEPIQVTTGATDGRNTEVRGQGLRPGMRVITGQRAATDG
jgi:HlyD family secretion protein